MVVMVGVVMTKLQFTQEKKALQNNRAFKKFLGDLDFYADSHDQYDQCQLRYL